MSVHELAAIMTRRLVPCRDGWQAVTTRRNLARSVGDRTSQQAAGIAGGLGQGLFALSTRVVGSVAELDCSVEMRRDVGFNFDLSLESLRVRDGKAALQRDSTMVVR